MSDVYVSKGYEEWRELEDDKRSEYAMEAAYEAREDEPCDHEDFVLMGVDDCEYESITFDVHCEYCGVIGELLLLVKDFDSSVSASAYSTAWPLPDWPDDGWSE